MNYRALALFLVLGALSAMGTFVALIVLLFGTNGRQPFLEILPFLLLALRPGAVLSGLTRLLPVQSVYKKAISLGLLLPALAVCAYFAIGLSQWAK